MYFLEIIFRQLVKSVQFQFYDFRTLTMRERTALLYTRVRSWSRKRYEEA